MWQRPSIQAESSSYINETVQGEEEPGSLSISDEPADRRILSSSPAALIFCRIPVVPSAFVSQLVPSDSVLEMSSNIQSHRLRGYRRRICGGSQRVRPYRRTNFNAFIETPSGNCNGQHFDQENVIRVGSPEESSFTVSSKRNGGNSDIEDLFDNQQESVNITPLSNELTLSPNHLQIADRGILMSPGSNEDSSSMETFSQSLLQFSPSYIQSNPSVTQIDHNYQNSNTVDELLLETETELPLIPLNRTNNTCKESYDLNSKSVFPNSSQIINRNAKPLLYFDDPLLSPLRIVPELPMPTANAQKLANNLIKLSRYLKSPDLTELCCPDCRFVPVLPVTGQCGHTRCMRCILVNGACPCGANAPKTLFVNTVVREITEKMMRYIKKPRIIDPGSSARTHDDETIPLMEVKPRYLVRRRQQIRSLHLSCLANSPTHCLLRPRMPMTVQARHRRARHLVNAGKYLEAASHLIRVAASSEPFARLSRILLAQTISAMCHGKRRSSVSRKLCQSVREQSAHSWLRPSDLECVLCTNTYTNPVSTPCGHTYCRTCIERSLYYKKKCALCLSSLENFRLAETRDTVFISSILSSIDVLPLPDETDVIPVVTCYVAFPGMPCPLFIFDPRYWLMVRRVLESGSRRFGMLAYEKGHTFADYGTVLEICDCVVLEDSRCIVSTVGVSRFRVIERYDRDGCDVARIQSLTDIAPTRDEIQDLPMLALQIYCKAVEWLNNMDENVREEIETAFGSLPYDDRPAELGTTSDGPNWLWWLIAILPLKSEIKILILSTRSLLKRMLAVSRTLDVMDTDFTSNAVSEEVANHEEWLPRNS